MKYDGALAETRFRLSAKRTNPFKSAGGRQFSRLLAAGVCASAVVMLDTPCSKVVWCVLATHSIRQFRPSLPLPCVFVCHHISTGLCYCLESSVLISVISFCPYLNCRWIGPNLNNLWTVTALWRRYPKTFERLVPVCPCIAPILMFV